MKFYKEETVAAMSEIPLLHCPFCGEQGSFLPEWLNAVAIECSIHGIFEMIPNVWNSRVTESLGGDL